MIKINKVYSEAFIEDYLRFAQDKVVEPRVQLMLAKVPASLKSDVSAAFNKAELERMLTGRPEILEATALRLFNQFPVIAERYCYSYLLEQVILPTEALHLKLSSPAQKKDFDRAIIDTTNTLKTLVEKYSLHLTPHYISLLESDIPSSEKKRHLCRLLNAQRGRSQVTDADKKLLPDWVNDLAKCFDYEVVAKEFGHRLIDQLAITVCPYCALESVQAYGEIDVRPELDHFYPKSRFPFLAVALYNLIPAGWICNQRHKRNNPMLGRLNPYMTGLEQGRVFKFGFLPDGDVRENMSIQLLAQGCDQKDRHVELFKLEALYSGTEDLREWLAETYEMRQWLKEADQLKDADFRHPPYRAYIDLRRPVTKVRAQKFKVDALNDLFDQHLEVVTQPTG